MFDWISAFIHQVGPFGIALLMFLENVFPPIPSELIIPLAGFNAAEGHASLPVVILSGSLGSLAGALFWYWIGRRIGHERLGRLAQRHGRWLTMTPDEVGAANDWFHRYGGLAVLTGRLVPTVRTFISVPAGVARMPLPAFLAFTAVGTVAWTSLLAFAGYWLQTRYTLVEGWLNPASTLVIAVLVAWYLWRVATFPRRVPLVAESEANERGE
ncbi:DedA family protein [Acuticoccus kandeliae]|uniref:DedA family protein n=1 Tax=Acuticoccus kandeliae TaxID=2073160 RepID=UPI000D3E8ABF|nr:DedA family protein [Acuticoccus kandeliae]